MRVLIISPLGAGLDVALRAQKEGHEVKFFTRNTEQNKHVGEGFVEVIDDYRPWLKWAEIVINTDNTHYLRDLDSLREQKINHVISASTQAAEWELDREVGQKIFQKNGIVTPPYRMFTDYEKAIEFVKKEDRRFVSKACGDADKALSYVSKSPEDLVYMLERWKKTSKLKGEFILQEFVEGIEMAVGGWFGPGGWNVGWCENFEFKKLMNNDMGVNTGEQGTVVRYVKTSKLASKILMPLTKALSKLNYIGYVDVNCIIDDSGTPWPMEFTMRPGWPTYNIQMALHEGDSIEWLADLAKGKDARNLILNEIALGVVLSIPDYPYSKMTRKEVTGIPIYGITPGLWKHLHPCEMMISEAPVQTGSDFIMAPVPATAGDYVLVMTAVSGTVQGAQRKAYRRLKRLTVPNSPMYRTDIGSRLRKQLPDLQKNGYALNMTFSTPAES